MRWWSSPRKKRPSTATLLGEVMNAVGMPKGVYNVVHGFGPGFGGRVADAPSRRRRASPSPARRAPATAIMKAAAEGVRPVSFELGGKNAALVFADCDFDAAIDRHRRARCSPIAARCAWAPSASMSSGRSSTSSSPR